MSNDNSYQVKADYMAERLGDKAYKTRDSIAAKWTPMAQDENDDVGFCSNYSSTFYYSRDVKQFVPSAEGLSAYCNPDYVGLYGVISSADMLYRLACTFKPVVQFLGPEGYKLVWSAAFRHKSGAEILFYEWKGGCTFGARGKNGARVPASKAFQKDVLQLLNYLCSDGCVHPYDGCVAGSVA
jgi:hypothetical protein